MYTQTNHLSGSEYKQPIGVTAIYVLAIIGFLFAICCGPIGLILAVIAVVLSVNKMSAYKQNPSAYVGIESLKTAQIVAYISLAINVLATFYFIYAMATGGYEQIIRAFEEGYHSGYEDF